jgi:hypothetical protein
MRTIYPDRAVYRLRVAGHLEGSHWAACFGGLSVAPEAEGATLITGPVADQAALHGLLAVVRDLNLVLLSVERVETADDCRKSGEGGS